MSCLEKLLFSIAEEKNVNLPRLQSPDLCLNFQLLEYWCLDALGTVVLGGLGLNQTHNIFNLALAHGTLYPLFDP